MCSFVVAFFSLFVFFCVKALASAEYRFLAGYSQSDRTVELSDFVGQPYPEEDEDDYGSFSVFQASLAKRPSTTTTTSSTASSSSSATPRSSLEEMQSASRANSTSEEEEREEYTGPRSSAIDINKARQVRAPKPRKVKDTFSVSNRADELAKLGYAFPSTTDDDSPPLIITKKIMQDPMFYTNQVDSQQDLPTNKQSNIPGMQYEGLFGDEYDD